MPFSRPVPTIAKALVSVAICFASAPAYANAACQGSNCVFPVRDAPPPPVAEPVAFVEEEGGFGLLPILAVVAAVALLAFLLIDDDDEEDSISA
jgi:hypothetical protein